MILIASIANTETVRKNQQRKSRGKQAKSKLRLCLASLSCLARFQPHTIHTWHPPIRLFSIKFSLTTRPSVSTVTPYHSPIGRDVPQPSSLFHPERDLVVASYRKIRTARSMKEMFAGGRDGRTGGTTVFLMDVPPGASDFRTGSFGGDQDSFGGGGSTDLNMPPGSFGGGSFGGGRGGDTGGTTDFLTEVPARIDAPRLPLTVRGAVFAATFAVPLLFAPIDEWGCGAAGI